MGVQIGTQIRAAVVPPPLVATEQEEQAKQHLGIKASSPPVLSKRVDESGKGVVDSVIMVGKWFNALREYFSQTYPGYEQELMTVFRSSSMMLWRAWLEADLITQANLS